MRSNTEELRPEFVEYIPSEAEELLPGFVYISMKYNTVVHRCPCGCGGLSEFMLDPIRFRMDYDGQSVTFHPSIGNSNLVCRSHYWIVKNRIKWCAPMEDWETQQAGKRERAKAIEARAVNRVGSKKWTGRLWERVVKCWRA